jgi:hypothetical protein
MKNTACRPKIIVSADGSGIVSRAGALLLARVLQVTGLERQLSAGLGKWRPPRAVYDPGKMVADLAVAVALGGDCLADVAVLRAEPELFGHRFTCFATSTKGGQPADLELRHRRRARCEDRIRCAKDTGLRNMPLHGYAQNQIWCEITAMACELLAWLQILAFTGPARRWEPKRCG